MKKYEKSNFVGYVDVIRIFGALAVVIIHLLSSLVLNSSEPVAFNTALTMNFVHNLMNWAVPVFFIVTGFLFLGGDKECTYKSILKHIYKMLLVLLVFGLFYSLIEQIFTMKSVSLNMIPKAFSDILTGNLWDHMWYIYSIIGMYLLLPLVKPFFSQETKSIAIVVAISFVFTILIPSIGNIFEWEIAFTFPIGEYSFYVFVGALIAKLKIKRIHLIFAALGFAASILYIAYYILLEKNETVGYLSTAICVLAVSIFLLLQMGFKNYVPNVFVHELSACTLGIYLIHPFFINLQVKLFQLSPLSFCPALLIPINCIMIFALSGLSVFVVRKIPIIRKYLL